MTTEELIITLIFVVTPALLAGTYRAITINSAEDAFVSKVRRKTVFIVLLAWALFAAALTVESLAFLGDLGGTASMVTGIAAMGVNGIMALLLFATVFDQQSRLRIAIPFKHPATVSFAKDYMAAAAGLFKFTVKAGKFAGKVLADTPPPKEEGPQSMYEDQDRLNSVESAYGYQDPITGKYVAK